MKRSTVSRRKTRSTALVASALVAVGAFAAPSARLLADAPSQPASPPAAEAQAPSPDAPKEPLVVLERVETEEIIAPRLKNDRPLRISLEDARKFEALVDLYAYAYPLVLSHEIKHDAASRAFFATTNETAYFPRLPDARFRATEFPNVDSIFATAWLDLSREAQVFVAPANTNVPFSVEIVDAWSNVVASFDEKSLLDLPIFNVDGRSVRAFALVGPNSPKSNELPPEIRVVKSPSSLALALTRVFVDAAKRQGPMGTRPAVQTLYDFATVPVSTFTTSARVESSKANVAPLPSAPQTAEPKLDADAAPAPKTDAKTESENNVDQELTPPQTSAFGELERLYIAQNAARYAGRADEEKTPKDDAPKPETSQETQKDDNTSPEDKNVKDESATVSDARETSQIGESTEKKTEENGSNDAESSSEPSAKEEKTPLNEDDAASSPKSGESNYERERREERRDVSEFWRKAKEEGRETARSAEAAYEEAKRWFFNRFEHNERFWSDFNDAMKRDARRDLRPFERFVETPRPTRPWFEGPVERVAHMSPEKYWSTFVELLKTNPPTGANAEILNSLRTLGIEPGRAPKFDADLRKLSRGAFSIARKKIEIAAQSEMWRNTTPTNWVVFKNLGDFGDDYLFRAGVASVSFGANVDKNVVYPFAFLDANGDAFDGEASYVLRFPAGEEPPTDFLWSLTLYDADRYLARNKWNKYGVRSDDALKRNADGSLEILLQREKPQGDASNWIPTPSGPFVLALRIYRPNEKATNGAWTPPAVQKIERETTVK
ncbi:MAG: DUF1214 domain-containing protein [Thermoguttaceae bacterium]|nr:DUF1214 domain-containing protein [Thermoguttaceae bacterium]